MHSGCWHDAAGAPGTGRHARPVANLDQSGADQSRSRRAHEQRRGPDRRRFGQRRDRDALPGGRLGSDVADLSDADARAGTCSATAWSCCTTAGCSSTAATSSTTRFSASREMRCSTPRPALFTDVQNMAHGRWYPTVDHARRWPRDDVLGIARNRRHEHRRRDLHGGFGMESGVSRGLDAAALSAHAPEHGWSSLLRRLGSRLQVLQSRQRIRGRPSSPTPTTRGSRGYGTSVLLPLTPANGYRPRVMILGGASPATATTEIIDLSARNAARGSTDRRCPSRGSR